MTWHTEEVYYIQKCKFVSLAFWYWQICKLLATNPVTQGKQKFYSGSFKNKVMNELFTYSHVTCMLQNSYLTCKKTQHSLFIIVNIGKVVTNWRICTNINAHVCE